MSENTMNKTKGMIAGILFFIFGPPAIYAVCQGGFIAVVGIVALGAAGWIIMLCCANFADHPNPKLSDRIAVKPPYDDLGRLG